ncbi:hypothetical protein J6590_072376 [Homalodisca vitripennis]|nr:hypothetical protein J6590_072376 [Homalodisca vitripennis]
MGCGWVGAEGQGTNMAKGTSNHSNGPHMWVIQLHLSRTFTADTLTWNCLHLSRTFTADTLTPHCVCLFSYICSAPLLRTL